MIKAISNGRSKNMQENNVANYVINGLMLIVSCFAAWAAKQSADSAAKAQKRADEIHKIEKLLAQRQFIVPLWQQTSTLASIDPETPKTDDVVKALNVLELVAVCYEGEMVDKQVMKRIFAENFMNLFRQIRKCQKKIPGLNKDGDELLNQCPAVKQLFEELEKEADSKHKPGSLS